ncbi:substrate-binding domain-containing protein [Limimaricola pyoseonensis]|uniref:Transcriptional regulator, LacI family n=1 Tax=Limimaricola pyoseonensis TaxID=521013 RepID=A0A1G7DAK1_9RHOB|nr:substrate-binding domain-containing protein [Limimaricola pyoseonensis]SDE47936.1 transcriptional regulator, LacI family [Limimaricola pyoseonensis]
MSATLKDIAATTGLSVTQVSRALNDHDDVSAETKARVRDAARALDYRPNLSARRLASGRSGIVGLVLPPEGRTPRDSMVVQMVRGLSAEFSRMGRLFVLHAAEPEEDVVAVHGRLIDGGSLDGFVLIEPVPDDPRIAYLRSRGVPLVLHGRTEDRPNYPFFDLDNREVGRRLTRMLLERGHRRIGFVNGLPEMCYVMRRSEGWQEALREAGVAPAPELQEFGAMSESHGALATLRMMSESGPRPTGLIAGNMLIAKGIYGALSMLGLRVPEDVSVVVHDDQLPGEDLMAMPATSGTRSPLAESWAPLARALIGAIENRPLAELQETGQFEVVERGSVAAPGPEFRTASEPFRA